MMKGQRCLNGLITLIVYPWSMPGFMKINKKGAEVCNKLCIRPLLNFLFATDAEYLWLYSVTSYSVFFEAGFLLSL